MPGEAPRSARRTRRRRAAEASDSGRTRGAIARSRPARSRGSALRGKRRRRERAYRQLRGGERSGLRAESGYPDPCSPRRCGGETLALWAIYAALDGSVLRAREPVRRAVCSRRGRLRSRPSPSRLHRQGDALGTPVRSRRPARRVTSLERVRVRRRSRSPTRQPDPFRPRLREPALARRRARIALERAASVLEPVRPRRQPASRRRAGRDLPPRDLARDPPSPPALVDLLLRVHALPRSPRRIPLLSRRSRCRTPAALHRRGGMGRSRRTSLFWNGWSVGPSTATFPLLLLGLRRLARGSRSRNRRSPSRRSSSSLAGGHPESLFHGVAAAGRLLRGGARQLAARRSREARRTRRAPRRSAPRPAGLALLLAGPQLFPLLEAIPRSAEYRERGSRRTARRPVAVRVAPREAARAAAFPRFFPSRTGSTERVPSRPSARTAPGCRSPTPAPCFFRSRALGADAAAGRDAALFLSAAAAGLLLGASAPGLIDVLTRLPGFALALNYRLVFLAGFGLAGLAALGAEARSRREDRAGVAAAGARAAAALGVALSPGRSCGPRDLPLARPSRRVRRGAAALFADRRRSLCLAPRRRPLAPKSPAARVVRRLRPARVSAALEMGGDYPTLAGRASSRPRLSSSIALGGGAPAASSPRAATCAPTARRSSGLEDVRGYESIVLDRFADTYPLWCVPQPASFNRVDDLTRPFLAFLSARLRGGALPTPRPPAGWDERERSAALALFENPRALPRAFVPARIVADPRSLAASCARWPPPDFSRRGVDRVRPGGVRELTNARFGSLRGRRVPDLSIDVRGRRFRDALRRDVAAGLAGMARATRTGAGCDVQTVNHAFVGVLASAVPAGTRVRLSYRPRLVPRRGSPRSRSVVSRDRGASSLARRRR